MNYELFIAKRFTTAKKDKSSVSTPIIKIAITAISLGIVMMLIAVATGTGLQNKIREKITVFKGHIQITKFDNNTSENSQFPISTNQVFYPKFKNIEGIKHVQVFASKAGIIRTEKDFEGIVLKGVGSDYDWHGISEYLVKGRFPDFSQKRSSEVLISEEISNRLGLELGSSFDTYFIKKVRGQLPNRRIFNVVGIYNSGFKEFDESYIIGDIRQIQHLNRWKTDEVGGFEIYVDDFTQLEEIGKQVYEEIDSTLDSSTIFQLFPTIFEWLNLFDFNIIIIIVILILVAGINMITALLVLVLERTQTIGVLKALGSSNWSIRKVFLYNASYIILRGLLIGNFIGVGLLYIQKYFQPIQLDPAIYYVTTAPVAINWFHILLVNVITLMLCVLMLLIPSYLVTKIHPAKAIKFE